MDDRENRDGAPGRYRCRSRYFGDQRRGASGAIVPSERNKPFSSAERTLAVKTWDLFKYPGIRSDSDMHTLGFSFKPWNTQKSIADGPSIMRVPQRNG